MPGLHYRQWTVDKVPAANVVRTVRSVSVGQGGHVIREDELAKYAAQNQGLKDKDVLALPVKYQSWFNLPRSYSQTDQTDYAQIAKRLDALELQSKAELSTELRRVRAALATKLKTAKSPKAFKVLPRRAELEAAVRAMLDRAHAAGGEAIREEVPRAYAEWDESKHSRGETTPQSTPGSFAPNESGDVQLYHGTSKAAWRDIAVHGIMPGKGKGADAWSKKIGWNIENGTVGDRKLSVFLTADKDIAAVYGSRAAEMTNSEAIIVTVRIPAAERSRIIVDEKAKNGLRLKGNILPEWVQYSEKAFTDMTNLVVYAVVLVRDLLVKKTYASFNPRAATKWLADAAFWVTDVLSTGLLSSAQGILVRGLKNGTATSVMMGELWEAFVPYLGSRVGEEVVTAHRLETIVRTNTTTAYNHGRLTEMLGADVARFVDGVRYSAILDERTTEVCQFLDGKVFRLPAAQEEVELLLPPRHFNCRSIIVPIVVGSPIDPADVITAAEVARARVLSGAGFTQRGAFNRYGNETIVQDVPLLAARAALLRAQLALYSGTWDESKHPRVPAGSGDLSGEFAPKGTENLGAGVEQFGPGSIRYKGKFYHRVQDIHQIAKGKFNIRTSHGEYLLKGGKSHGGSARDWFLTGGAIQTDRQGKNYISVTGVQDALNLLENM